MRGPLEPLVYRKGSEHPKVLHGQGERSQKPRTVCLLLCRVLGGGGGQWGRGLRGRVVSALC